MKEMSRRQKRQERKDRDAAMRVAIVIAAVADRVADVVWWFLKRKLRKQERRHENIKTS